MTTDLTGDFELGEEEFDWDVFVPDPDDAEIAARTAALDDEDELDLDDSDFDWDAALRADPEPEAGADGGARAGAAYDRIVDTVRRSFEEPESEADPEPEPEAVAIQSTETAAVPIWAPDAQDRTGALFAAPEPGAEPDQEVWLLETELEPEEEFELDEEPAWALESDASRVAEPELEPELEPVEARIAEMAATVASVAPVESLPIAPSEAEPDVDSETAGQWEVAGDAISDESPVPPPTRRSRSHKKREPNGRSRVFTATLVLACLALVIVAAAAVVHSRHHPTTAGVPTPAAAPASPSSETARIQAATDAVDSATTSATVGLSSLASFPTPANVEKIINPYVSSLQLYGNLLSGSTVPAAAQSQASNAEAQVHQDLQFLDTIDTLPALHLGAFLKQFDTDATRLQTTLSALEQNLRTTTS
jgi:hypothetical protein